MERGFALWWSMPANIIDVEEQQPAASFLRGPKGSIQLAVTFTDRSNGKREYQVSRINTGTGWTRECPDMPGILQRHIGETYTGTRGKWLETIYHSKKEILPPPQAASEKRDGTW
jgi:hypothetical protein